jgi:hypothetical protein
MIQQTKEVNSMSIEPEHLRELITEVLDESDRFSGMNFNTPNAVELLMLTAAQESHLGRYLRQVRGPALGIFQMEPATMEDLFNNYIVFNDAIHDIHQYYTQGMHEGNFVQRAKGDLVFQIIMARINYYRKPGALPEPSDEYAMARYYKRHWNTVLGAATVEEAVKNYRRYAK